MKIWKSATLIFLLLLAFAWTVSGCEFIEFVTEPETETDREVASDTETGTEQETEYETEVEVETKHVHEFSIETVEKEPTCTESGLYVYTCICGEAKSVKVEATGHKFVDRVCEYCQAPQASEGLEFVSYGDGTCYVSGFGTCADKDVLIPSISPEGDRVIGIGDRAFYGAYVHIPHEPSDYNGITSVVIPDSVTKIGDEAFGECRQLVSIIIPDTVTEIGASAFANCESLQNVTIPENITLIRDRTFLCCYSITEMVIPEGVTQIGYEAFCECSNLVSIDLPDTVIDIGESAFAACKSLASIDIPKYMTVIRNSVFGDCHSLTEIVIPEGVTTIEHLAFIYCRKLEKLTIPSSVTQFSGVDEFCDSLRDIYYGGTRQQWADMGVSEDRMALVTIHYEGEKYPVTDSYDGQGLKYASNGDGTCSVYGNMYVTTKDIVIPILSPQGDRVTSIGEGAFSGCYFTSIEIPDSVISIGAYAFDGCQMASVIIPDSVVEIGEGAFHLCSQLTSIVLPDSVTSISSNMFAECSNLVTIEIPQSVTSIGEWAFAYCYGLQNVTIPDSVTSIDAFAFYGSDMIKNITFEGTQAQWSDIQKGECWVSDHISYTIHCTDGDIFKSEY